VRADLVLLGKVLGGGMPLAAYGGRRDLMRLIAPEGPVYQAGTYAAHPLAIAAALAVMDALDADPGLWSRLEGLHRAARARPRDGGAGRPASPRASSAWARCGRCS
jgi:glutamate-1-semialdehyde 2,1-aminomutase